MWQPSSVDQNLEFERKMLAQADRDIGLARRRLVQQQKIAGELHACGCPSSAPDRLVALTSQLLDEFEVHRRLMVARIASLERRVLDRRGTGPEADESAADATGTRFSDNSSQAGIPGRMTGPGAQDGRCPAG